MENVAASMDFARVKTCSSFLTHPHKKMDIEISLLLRDYDRLNMGDEKRAYMTVCVAQSFQLLNFGLKFGRNFKLKCPGILETNSENRFLFSKPGLKTVF